jgi:hypothetical protein
VCEQKRLSVISSGRCGEQRQDTAAGGGSLLGRSRRFLRFLSGAAGEHGNVRIPPVVE